MNNYCTGWLIEDQKDRKFLSTCPLFVWILPHIRGKLSLKSARNTIINKKEKYKTTWKNCENSQFPISLVDNYWNLQFGVSVTKKKFFWNFPISVFCRILLKKKINWIYKKFNFTVSKFERFEIVKIQNIEHFISIDPSIDQCSIERFVSFFSMMESMRQGERCISLFVVRHGLRTMRQPAALFLSFFFFFDDIILFIPKNFFFLEENFEKKNSEETIKKKSSII